MCKRNFWARPCDCCCRGESVSITRHECVLVALGIQHAMRMRHAAICGLPRSKILFAHYLINGAIFEKKKIY